MDPAQDVLQLLGGGGPDLHQHRGVAGGDRASAISGSAANSCAVSPIQRVESTDTPDGEVFASAGAREAARFDHLRFDDGGRIRAAALNDGVHCYDPDGTLIGRLDVPEAVANIPWGRAKRNRLFTGAQTASTRSSWV